jgi:hypothetical protein
MLQITPQMRILVALEAVDFRKGSDSLEGVPGQTPDGSVFGLPVWIPQPASNLYQGLGLRLT